MPKNKRAQRKQKKLQKQEQAIKAAEGADTLNSGGGGGCGSDKPISHHPKKLVVPQNTTMRGNLAKEQFSARIETCVFFLIYEPESKYISATLVDSRTDYDVLLEKELNAIADDMKHKISFMLLHNDSSASGYLKDHKARLMQALLNQIRRLSEQKYPDIDFSQMDFNDCYKYTKGL